MNPSLFSGNIRQIADYTDYIEIIVSWRFVARDRNFRLFSTFFNIFNIIVGCWSFGQTLRQ